jgi:hypothetical protein
MKYDFITASGKENELQELQPLSTADPFDLDRAKQHFAVFESKIKDWAKAIKAADLKTEADAADFTDTIGKAKSLVKEFEKRRKDITKEAYDFYKDVMGFEKFYTNMIEKEVIGPANSKLSFYFTQIQIERQKAEKAAQVVAAGKQKELDKIADDAGVDRVKLDKPILKKSKSKIVGSAASATPKTDWLYKVLSINIVPRDFLMVNDKAVKQAIKNGERDIAGLQIYQETKAQVRARR